MNKSPDRYTFQKNNYLERQAEEGKTPDNNETVKAMVSYYESWKQQDEENERNPDWRENNMEYDLRSTAWICDKVKSDEVYAQNLYAAMCNNDFQRNDMMPILKGETWGCSWRYAGGIVADMCEDGDYIDWYCSGIRNQDPIEQSDWDNLTLEEQQRYKQLEAYVSESVVTDEIRIDLKKLGWNVVDTPDDDIF
jgi:hypothetical protein